MRLYDNGQQAQERCQRILQRPFCTIDVASLKSSRFSSMAASCATATPRAINATQASVSTTARNLLKVGEAVSDDAKMRRGGEARRHGEDGAGEGRREAPTVAGGWRRRAAARREPDEAYAPLAGAPAPPRHGEGTDQAASRHQSRVGENDRSRGAPRRAGGAGGAAVGQGPPRRARTADDGRAADGEEKRARAADAAAAEAKERGGGGRRR